MVRVGGALVSRLDHPEHPIIGRVPHKDRRPQPVGLLPGARGRPLGSNKAEIAFQGCEEHVGWGRDHHGAERLPAPSGGSTGLAACLVLRAIRRLINADQKRTRPLITLAKVRWLERQAQHALRRLVIRKCSACE